MENLVKIESIIKAQENNFHELTANHQAVTFKKECEFALQLLQKNSFLAKVAEKDQLGLEQAIKQIASIGVSLNPALKHAYLVPRGGNVVLDVSYMGMVNLAVESGSLKWAKAEVVRRNDNFESKGFNELPIHEFDAFADIKERGDVIGAYCVAKTKDDEYLVEIMSSSEINKIRDNSEAYKGDKKRGTSYSPWISFYEEMCKKTVIKRAAKLWPRGDKRLHYAIENENIIEGYDKPEEINSDTIKEIKYLLEKKGRDEQDLLEHISAKKGYAICDFNELTQDEGQKLIAMLDSLQDKE